MSEEATLMGFRNVFFQGMASFILITELQSTKHSELIFRALLDGNCVRYKHFSRKLTHC